VEYWPQGREGAPAAELCLPKRHTADVPETRASLMAVGKKLGWAPRIFFPKTGDSDAKKV
jgi:hypothetical protein